MKKCVKVVLGVVLGICVLFTALYAILVVISSTLDWDYNKEDE